MKIDLFFNESKLEEGEPYGPCFNVGRFPGFGTLDQGVALSITSSTLYSGFISKPPRTLLSPTWQFALSLLQRYICRLSLALGSPRTLSSRLRE